MAEVLDHISREMMRRVGFLPIVENLTRAAIWGILLFVIGQLGLGAAATWFIRDSRYDAFPDVSQNGRQIRVFASIAGPRWMP